MYINTLTKSDNVKKGSSVGRGGRGGKRGAVPCCNAVSVMWYAAKRAAARRRAIPSRPVLYSV